MRRGLVIWVTVCLWLPVSGRQVSVRMYGAKGDGEVCTEALNRAISEAEDGDTVFIPEGRYVTGTVRLRSHLTLRIERGAEVCGAEELALYEWYNPSKTMTKYDTGLGSVNENVAGDAEWCKALILGERVEDVRIMGEGVIDGRHVENPAGEEGMRGPHALLLAECGGVTVEGIKIRRAGNYAVMGYEWEDVTVRGVTVEEGWDGIHVRGGRNVSIMNCDIMTGDDAVAGGYWENMVIKGCRLNPSCNGIRMIEPSRGLLIEGCTIYGPGRFRHRTRGDEERVGSIYAIVLEPGAWGKAPGVTENVCVRDLTVENVLSVFVYSMGEGNECRGLVMDGVRASGVRHNTLPVNWQGGSEMWRGIEIRDFVIL